MNGDSTDAARLDDALRDLVADGTLTTDQAEAVATRFSRTTGEPDDEPDVPGDQPEVPGDEHHEPDDDRAWLATVAELGGYTGAAFVVGALFALLGSGWHDLPWAVRLLLVAGAGVAVLYSAVRLGGGDAPARARLTQVLLVIATALGGGVVALLTPANSDQRTAPAALLVGAAASYRYRRGQVTHVAAIAAAAAWVITFGDWTTEGTSISNVLVGLLLIALGAAWGWATWTGALPELVTGVLAAGITAWVGTEYLIVDGDLAWLGYLLMLALAVVALAGYARRRELVLLAVGALTLVVLVPQALIQYTDGALGAAAGLLMGGVLLVGGSVMVLRRSMPT